MCRATILAPNASDAEIAGFLRAVSKIARQVGVVDSGYRLLANHGRDANQEVPHFHMHIFGGRRIGRWCRRPISSSTCRRSN